jgi:hypothetical protein
MPFWGVPIKLEFPLPRDPAPDSTSIGEGITVKVPGCQQGGRRFRVGQDLLTIRRMTTTTHAPNTEAAIWTRIVDPEIGDLSLAGARMILQLDFPPADRDRMDELAEKAGEGTLTLQERQEAAAYNRVGHLLALLQSKARRSLHRAGKKA